ncbi:MAG TPA: hypothetical protein VKU82_14530 [Planctomycetaceae bacterium]|nr:hypothetical protein [Planctomycetaceae bacterium]
MNKFKVWLRPSGIDCKVRVDGPGNVRLLRERLQAKGISSSEPIAIKGTSHCILHAHYPPQVTEEGLVMYVASIPEVELMLDPA